MRALSTRTGSLWVMKALAAAPRAVAAVAKVARAAVARAALVRAVEVRGEEEAKEHQTAARADASWCRRLLAWP